MEDRANILREMKVCRFCLSNEEKQLGNIYERFSGDIKHSVPLPLQIMACIAIEVFKNDGMPQLICSTCRNLTMQAYTFKTNCKKADDALKLFLATGQLSKPYMHKVDQMNVIPQSVSTITKTIRILNKQRPPKSNEPVQAILPDLATLEPKPKQIKKEETTTEILTLNIDPDGVQRSEDNEDIEVGEIREGENVIEYENEVEEDDRAEEEGVQQAQQQNNYSNVEQVPTECFPCPKCHRSFPLKQLLDLHLPIHNRERAFQCEECSRKFFTKYDLQKHASTHTGQKPFTCVICFKNFSRETLLRRHEKTHDNVPRYMCNQCDKTFLTKDYLDFHMDKHKKKRPFVCETCNKSFVFKQGLERHEIIHSQNKPHKCNYCEASFTSAIKLTRHITSHAGLRPYPCKLCGRTFLLSHHLTRHMRSHYAVESRKPQDAVVNQHKCDICSMSFRRKDSLINHSAIHSMVNLRCVICNTSFESAKMVKEHITTHLADLPYPCEKCDYSFETAEQLEEHELKHAEMEYEEQIEREVISEALQKRGGVELGGTGEEGDSFLEEEEGEMEGLEEGEVQEFTITDINNVELAPRGIIRRKRERNVGSYVRFLKDELASDVEEGEEEDNKPPLELQGLEEQSEPDTEPIKPIIRVEGTKVYQRKVSVEKKLPEILPEPANLATLQQITQPDTHINDIEDLNLQTVNKLHPSKHMKTGDKVTKGQTFIVTKEEMKAMAKLGILEMKNGQVVFKNAGHPVLNATLKSIQKTDIESILDRKNKSRQQLKQYQKRTVEEKHVDDENIRSNIQGTSLGINQLK